MQMVLSTGIFLLFFSLEKLKSTHYLGISIQFCINQKADVISAHAEQLQQ